MILDRRSPTDKILYHDASTIQSVAGGPIDVAVILGSGLSSMIAGGFSYEAIPYDRMLGIPIASLEGHAGEALVGTWKGKRVLAFAGRVHLYQGFSPQQVTTNVRLAHTSGARAVVLTNAAASVDPLLSPGDVMLIADQINLTGRNPLVGLPLENPFVAMHDAYSVRLRELAKRMAAPELRLGEGVYAGVLGPSFETPAEARYLRTIGAHAVGMSTVLEACFARSLGLEVLGFSVIANTAGKPASRAAIDARASEAGQRLAGLVDALMEHV
jgi:purine-nucleoside phosphorylase